MVAIKEYLPRFRQSSCSSSPCPRQSPLQPPDDSGDRAHRRRPSKTYVLNYIFFPLNRFWGKLSYLAVNSLNRASTSSSSSPPSPPPPPPPAASTSFLTSGSISPPSLGATLLLRTLQNRRKNLYHLAIVGRLVCLHSPTSRVVYTRPLPPKKVLLNICPRALPCNFLVAGKKKYTAIS